MSFLTMAHMSWTRADTSWAGLTLHGLVRMLKAQATATSARASFHPGHGRSCTTRVGKTDARGQTKKCAQGACKVIPSPKLMPASVQHDLNKEIEHFAPRA